MAVMPKKVRTHCPFCRKHTPHEVERVKKGRVSGTTKIARQKRRQSKVGNRGKFSKVPGGEKPTKKVALRFRCSVCKKAHLREGFRAGKFELTE